VKQFEEIMSSLAFTEVGEIDSAMRILNERHKVLLVLTGEETDMKAARYALNICKRIGVAIEILYITRNDDEIPFLEEYLKELRTKGIEYHVRRCRESMKWEIIRLIEKEKGIEFVVIDSKDLGLDQESDKPKTLKKWGRLTCPLVLVSWIPET